MTDELTKSICVVGSGAAGLITAHTLLRDGFTNVSILSRDRSAGGVWAEERVYPELSINNVHGEYRFSALQMQPSIKPHGKDPRLSGEDMRAYMELFAETFLKGKIQYGVEIVNIRRVIPQRKPDASTAQVNTARWVVSILSASGERSELEYERLVLCSGGCSEPFYPLGLEPEIASTIGFSGPVIHSSTFKAHLSDVLDAVKPLSDDNPGMAVIVGGGKSAQDIAAYLAHTGRNVSLIFETADSFAAFPIPLPDFVRKSRFVSIFSPYSTLRTGLERFLHTTRLGSKVVHGVWGAISWIAFKTLDVPSNSPLRRVDPLFWGVRANDEGVKNSDGFHALVNEGKIQLIAPARAERYGDDGHSIVLKDGRSVGANAVILATGFRSSWDTVLDASTMAELGMDRRPPSVSTLEDVWDYVSLRDPPQTDKPICESDWGAPIYRGIVPGKNLANRDFALNGAVFTINNGYCYEVVAHWIASYFRNDAFLRLPASSTEAIEAAELHNAWLRKRYPGTLGRCNESNSADIAFWNWPQAMDTLLEDMNLKLMRSGGNWFTWPFKVISVSEIADLAEERAAKRRELSAT